MFHLVYYLDSFNNHFRREVRVLYGIEDSFDALDVAKCEVSYYSINMQIFVFNTVNQRFNVRR